MSKNFKLTGKVFNQQNTGISGLTIEAWDKDLFINDFLGKAVTTKNGQFRISFDESKFKDYFNLDYHHGHHHVHEHQ